MCCWRILLRVPWTARRSNQSILREISPEYSLEGLMLKDSNTLATWCKELTHWQRPWCWERLKVGGKGDDRGWDGWMASPAQWTWVWISSGSWWWTGKPGVLQSMGLQKVRHDWVTELNSAEKWSLKKILTEGCGPWFPFLAFWAFASLKEELHSPLNTLTVAWVSPRPSHMSGLVPGVLWL